MSDRDATVLVLGGGPGGYVAAIRCAQLGLDTVLVEGEHLGGVCLNVGCIPSKAIIHAADEFALVAQPSSELGISASDAHIDLAETRRWKDSIVTRLNRGVGGLLRKAGAEVISGWGTMTDGKTCQVRTTAGDSVTVRAQHVILACGSVPIEVPSLPFGDIVVSSAGLLDLDAVPDRLVVVGGGYIGLELGTALAKFGAHVTVVEATDRLLGQYDAELVAPVRASLQRWGIDVLLHTTALDVVDDGTDSVVRVRSDDGDVTDVPADRVLVTVGRRSRLDGWGRENLVLDLDGRSVAADRDGRTSMHNVWAIGDLTGEPMLAHRATAQAEVVAELIAGHRARFDPVAIPSVVFTDPEIATVGLSPAEAAAAGVETSVGRFPFSANGRAMTLNRDDGFVRLVARRDDGVILGIQAVGAGVADLVDTFTLALEMGAVAEDLAASIAAHPTQSEALHEAALLALGKGLHL